MTTEWTQKGRIKKTSFLKKATEIASNNHFPEAREIIKVITPQTLSGNFPPFQKSYWRKQTSLSHSPSLGFWHKRPLRAILKVQ